MLAQISQEEYSKATPISRVIVDDNPRRFGRVILPNSSSPVVLSWHSDLVQPLVSANPQESAVWIGIDRRIACLSSEGSILFSIGLNSNILQVLPSNKITVVLCEAEAITINEDFAIRRIISLRDLPETSSLDGNKLVVTFIDGETEAFLI